MNQVKGGIVLNYFIIALNIILGLLYTPYMLRMLGQNEYGLYSLVASIIAYLTLLDFGFGSAIVRYTSKLLAENKIKEQWELNGMFLCVYSIIGLIAIGVGILLYFNIDWLFEAKMTEDELSQARIMIILLIFNLALTFPLSIFGNIITAYQDFIFQRILTILRLLLTSGVIVFLLWLGYKAVAMVVVQTVFNISVLLINCIYCFKKLNIKISFHNFNTAIVKEIIVYSFWIFLSQIIDRIYWGTGQFVLGSIIGTSSVAVFSVAILLQQMYMSFANSISSVLLPKLTTLVNVNGNDKEVSDIFISTGRIQTYVLSMILSGFIIFGHDFISLWAGNDYDTSYYVTVIFFACLFIPLIQNTGYVILQARNKMKFRSLVYFAIAVVSFGMQIVLAKIAGIIGCAFAIGGALIIGQGLIMNIYYKVKQNIDINRFWKEVGCILFIPTFLTIIFCLIRNLIQFNNWVYLIIGIIIYTALYSISMYKFNFNKYEKSLFLSLYKKIRRKL